MIAFYIWLFFVAGCAINAHWLATLDLSRLDFLDGILIGQAYYIIVPLFVFLVEGQAEMADVGLDYRPFHDLGTTGMLIAGLFLFPGLRLVVPRIPRARIDSGDPRLPSAVMLLFLVSATVSFLLSGLAQGGHWQELDGAFGNPLFLPIKYTANVTRNAVFAVLLYQVTTGRTSAARATALGLLLAGLDLLTTFNRITVVYLLIMVLLLLKRHPVRMILTGAASLCSLSALSTLWPAFRGLATAQGYTLTSFIHAWQTARDAQGPGSLDASLNSVFESSNLVVLNWIVAHYGTSDKPFLAFAMFARPVTLLLPGSVWASRPQNFGLSLGNDIAQLPSLALNSTIYGESYANFGWFWPVGLIAFVLLWHAVYRLIAPGSRVVQMMGAFAGVAMWRFDASFVGCAALLTGTLVCALWLTRIGGRKPSGRIYPTGGAMVASVGRWSRCS